MGALALLKMQEESNLRKHRLNKFLRASAALFDAGTSAWPILALKPISELLLSRRPFLVYRNSPFPAHTAPRPTPTPYTYELMKNLFSEQT